MKTRIYLLLILLIGIFAVSCSNSEETTETEASFDDEGYSYYHDKMAEIAEINAMLDTSYCFDYSLDYTNEYGESYLATLFCGKDKNVYKIEELTSNRARLITNNIFYFNTAGSLVATISERQEMRDTNLVFVEEFNFYGKENTIERSFSRLTTETEQGAVVLSKENKQLSTEKVLNAVNNKGAFALKFEGIVKMDDAHYLAVGCSEKNYTSALKITEKTAFIEELYRNEIRYIGKAIAVEFDRVIMGNLSFQELRDANWIE